MELDAYIELPADLAVRDAYVGDRVYSPMAMAIAAALKDGAAKRVVIPLREFPAGRIGNLPAEWAGRVELVEESGIADVADREVSRRMRNWAPAGSLHGPLMTTEYCTFGNPGEVVKGLGPGCRDFLLLMSGRHGFATPSATAQMSEAGERAGYREPVYFFGGPQGLFPGLWSREGLEFCRDHGRVAQAFIVGQRYWGSRFLQVPSEVAKCRYGFLLTTSKGRAFCRRVAECLRGEGFTTNPIANPGRIPAMQDICRVAEGPAAGAWVGDVPWDLEVEIDTARAIDPTWLPPRRKAARMPLAEFQRLVDSLGEGADSVTLTIGGEGDPAGHPDLEAMVRYAATRVRGVAVRVIGAGLAEGRLTEMLGWPLDMVVVRLGAYGEEAYSAVNGVSGFQPVWDAIVAARRRQGEQVPAEILPLIVPEVVKSHTGDRSVVQFYLESRAASLWPMVTPPMTYGGLCAYQGTLEQYPGRRYPCVRLAGQLFVRADGSAPMCSQLAGLDGGVDGVAAAGIPAMWKSGLLVGARSAHDQGEWTGASPACANCNQWHQLC